MNLMSTQAIKNRGSWASCAPLNQGRWRRRMDTMTVMRCCACCISTGCLGKRLCGVTVKLKILIKNWSDPDGRLNSPSTPLASRAGWEVASFKEFCQRSWPPPLYVLAEIKGRWSALEVSWNVMTSITILKCPVTSAVILLSYWAQTVGPRRLRLISIHTQISSGSHFICPSMALK